MFLHSRLPVIGSGNCCWKNPHSTRSSLRTRTYRIGIWFSITFRLALPYSCACLFFLLFQCISPAYIEARYAPYNQPYSTHTTRNLRRVLCRSETFYPHTFERAPKPTFNKIYIDSHRFPPHWLLFSSRLSRGFYPRFCFVKKIMRWGSWFQPLRG